MLQDLGVGDTVLTPGVQQAPKAAERRRRSCLLSVRVVDGDALGGAGGGGGGDSAPCTGMLFLLRLIVSPNSLQAWDSLSTRCWRPSSLWDVKAASSANSSSRMSTT